MHYHHLKQKQEHKKGKLENKKTGIFIKETFENLIKIALNCFNKSIKTIFLRF